LIRVDFRGGRQKVNAVQEAIRRGCWDVVKAVREARSSDKLLVKDRHDKLRKEEHEGTILHEVAYSSGPQGPKGDDPEMLELAKSLLKHCLELTLVPDSKMRIALHYAAAFSRHKLVAILMEHERENAMDLRIKASEHYTINWADDSGLSPLGVALYCKHLPVVQEMMKGGNTMLLHEGLGHQTAWNSLLELVGWYRKIGSRTSAQISDWRISSRTLVAQPEDGSSLVKPLLDDPEDADEQSRSDRWRSLFCCSRRRGSYSLLCPALEVRSDTQLVEYTDEVETPSPSDTLAASRVDDGASHIVFPMTYDIALLTFQHVLNEETKLDNVEKQSSIKAARHLNDLEKEICQKQLIALNKDESVQNYRSFAMLKSIFSQAGLFLFFQGLVVYCSVIVFAFRSVTGFTFQEREKSAVVDALAADSGVADVWDHLTGPVVEHLWPDGDDTGRSSRGWVNRFERKFGAVRYAQRRWDLVDCSSVTGDHLNMQGAQCVAEGDGHGFREVKTSTVSAWATGKHPHEHSKAFEWNKEAGAYVIDLPANTSRKSVNNMLKHLSDADWVGVLTSQIEMTYTLWSDAAHEMLVVRVLWQFDQAGTGVADKHITLVPWVNRLDEHTIEEVLRMSAAMRFLYILKHIVLSVFTVFSLRLEAMLVVATAYFIYSEWRQARRSPTVWWNKEGNRFDVMLGVVMLSIIVLQSTQLWFQTSLPLSQPDVHANMEWVVWLANMLMLVPAGAVFLGTIRLMLYLRLAPALGPHLQAMLRAIWNPQVLVFTGFFVGFTLALALGMLVAFGGGLKDYRNLTSALFNAFQAMRGFIKLSDLQTVHYFIGTFVYFMLTFLLKEMVTSTFMAVIVEAYKRGVSTAQDSWDEEVDKELAGEAWDDTERQIKFIDIKPATDIKSLKDSSTRSLQLAKSSLVHVQRLPWAEEIHEPDEKFMQAVLNDSHEPNRNVIGFWQKDKRHVLEERSNFSRAPSEQPAVSTRNLENIVMELKDKVDNTMEGVAALTALVQGVLSPRRRVGLEDGEQVASQFHANARVRRGPAWKWGNQDGGCYGRMVRSESGNWVSVRWDHGGTHCYRIGAEKQYDLCFVGHYNQAPRPVHINYTNMEGVLGNASGTVTSKMVENGGNGQPTNGSKRVEKSLDTSSARDNKRTLVPEARHQRPPPAWPEPQQSQASQSQATFPRSFSEASRPRTLATLATHREDANEVAGRRASRPEWSSYGVK